MCVDNVCQLESLAVDAVLENWEHSRQGSVKRRTEKLPSELTRVDWRDQ
jgi:hypothetical protein